MKDVLYLSLVKCCSYVIVLESLFLYAQKMSSINFCPSFIDSFSNRCCLFTFLLNVLVAAKLLVCDWFYTKVLESLFFFGNLQIHS
jgi:hypothetical protein